MSAARPRAESAVALGVIALGAFLLVGTREIGAGAGYDRIGPRVFPYAVAAGLIVLGVLLFRLPPATRRGAPREDLHPSPSLSPRPLVLLGVALGLALLLLEPAGFVCASSLQFWLAARAFHSRRPARDAVVALLLSAIVYVAFARGLGLALPAGVLEGLP